MNKLPVLSYTLLRDYDNCPRKANHLHVLKDLPKGPMSPELATGIAVHSAMEKAIKSGDTSDLGGYNLKLVQPLVGRQGVVAELMLGLTEDGRYTNFFSQTVWLRGKLDVVVKQAPQAVLLDWKTGKVREDPHELQVQALLLRAMYPPITQVKGCYVWLKDGKMGQMYDLSDTAPTLGAIRATAEEMRTTSWDRPTPNPLCGWCPVKSCEFNRNEK